MKGKYKRNELNHGLLIIVTVLPFFFVTYFYFDYASDAWFFQDDFLLIDRYSASPQVNQLFDFSDFGRFVSRNIYWFFGWKLFRDNASYYFIFNVFLIVSCSYLIYKIFEDRQNAQSAIVSSLFYFCLPAVIATYIWLSNSQHLLGHLFVILFIFHYLQSQYTKLNFQKVILLVFILVIGLLSNIFVGLVLSLPAWFMLTNKESGKDSNHWLMLIIGAVFFLFFVIKLKQNQPDVYSTSLSLQTVKINAEFYFYNLWLFAGWLIVSLAGACIAWRANRLFEAWLFIASPIFFIPFVFLEYQKSLKYAALPYLFFLLGGWALFYSLVEKSRWLIKMGGALVAIGLLSVSMIPIRYFSDNIWGFDQKQLVSELKKFNLSNGNEVRHYCFSPTKPNRNLTDIKAWDIPGEWWRLGFGKAFSLFVDPTKSYKLTDKGGPCEVVFFIDEPHLIRHMK